MRASESRLLQLRPEGLYCPSGGFHIDPWRPVETALITHAHADHARSGSSHYHAAEPGLPILRHRLGEDAGFHGHPYGVAIRFGETTVSFHPAGHVLGSAQIRVECEGEVWVVSGDYKRDPDPTCSPFEVVPCDVFITEATFGLPIYRWDPGTEVAESVLAWWDDNRRSGRPSLLFCYALGKSQRLLAELARLVDRPVYVHGALEAITEIYRHAGIPMLETRPVREEPKRRDWSGELVLAPPSAFRSPWSRRFRGADTAFASGWMRLRGVRRRRGYDRGFVLSDHADWPSLLETVEATGARRVLVTHGYREVLSRALNDRGIAAEVLETAFGGEEEDA